MADELSCPSCGENLFDQKLVLFTHRGRIYVRCLNCSHKLPARFALWKGEIERIGNQTRDRT